MKQRSRTPARGPDEQRGFSLIETTVAAGIVAGAFAALAQMFALSVVHNNAARDGSAAMVLAGQKMEQLRGLVRGVDLNEGGTLVSSVAGFSDYLDQAGNVLGAGGSMPRERSTFAVGQLPPCHRNLMPSFSRCWSRSRRRRLWWMPRDSSRWVQEAP